MTGAGRVNEPPLQLPADNHVHTEWSWDASPGSMWRSCEVAEALGLPAIAFTDHADFTEWAPAGTSPERANVRVLDVHASGGLLDDDGYWDCLARCREHFPGLRILAGLEIGEPHIFATESQALLDKHPYQRVLGSLHCLPVDGELVYVPKLLTADTAHEVMRAYFAEALRMVRTCDTFDVLAHIDFPTNAWPRDAKPYDATEFEDQYRAVLRALARSGRALEVNTQGPWPAPEVLRWWHEEGGQELAFGSDAHMPTMIGQHFTETALRVRAAGFEPGGDQAGCWRRTT